MANNYQTLEKYSGSLYGRPQYEGIEYDWEVPDNLVVGSPGGVDTIHHHYTKGFNGRGNTSSDVYAGQGQRYNAGVFGSLYQTGQEAGQSMGYYPAAPDYQFWQNQEPQQYAYSHGEASTWAPSMKIYEDPGAYETQPGEYQKKTLEKQEGFQHEETDFELIEQSDVTPLQNQIRTVEINQEEIEQKQKMVISTNISPWLLFLFFLLAFVVFDFWTEAGHSFIRHQLHKGDYPSWTRAVLYAGIITVIFGLVIYLAGVPVTTFETL
uniref:Transmembrane protein n=1 Tax=Marseillevirus LCMAC102 TaxID=2506603 RepID=A0A481YTY1_9VIRU|nr:MAG: uncharacterized protein LCMAC102_03440 [Marseillevirus LCMAC102]